MSSVKPATAILLVHCPDQKGIVAAVSDFLFNNSGNVLSLDQHVDREANRFFMRVEWALEGFDIPTSKIEEYFQTLIGNKFEMTFQLHFSNQKMRLALFVTKMSHCLYDILQRYVSGEWEIEIPLMISNHLDLKEVADKYGIPFHHFPITKENKAAQEAEELALLKANNIDLVVLARYMQVVTDTIIQPFQHRIVNIHHSFLPAFAGAKPYHAAYQRGVKIIGATCHYVTADLDEGPIITQNVDAITHKNEIEDLVRIGRNLEKVVLSEGIHLHLHHKVIVFKNRTVVFN